MISIAVSGVLPRGRPAAVPDVVAGGSARDDAGGQPHPAPGEQHVQTRAPMWPTRSERLLGVAGVVADQADHLVAGGFQEVAAVDGAGVDLGLDRPKREARDPGQVGAVRLGPNGVNRHLDHAIRAAAESRSVMMQKRHGFCDDPSAERTGGHQEPRPLGQSTPTASGQN